MTEEQQPEFHDEDVVSEPEDAVEADPSAEDTETAEDVASTGHPAVDEVLRSLDALGEAPVDEHVAVFEQAHEQLRRTLQGAGDEE